MGPVGLEQVLVLFWTLPGINIDHHMKTSQNIFDEVYLVLFGSNTGTLSFSAILHRALCVVMRGENIIYPTVFFRDACQGPAGGWRVKKESTKHRGSRGLWDTPLNWPKLHVVSPKIDKVYLYLL